MSCHVKICGLSEETTLQAAINGGAAFVGFVHFEKSPRHVSLEKAATFKALLPTHVESVLVVVDPDDALLKKITTTLTPDYIQLHGKETPARVAEIRKQYPKQKLLKAISVSSAADLAAAKDYNVDMMMFDAKPPAGAELPGGNGIAFDWTILKGFQSKLPWMLSGGLTAGNVTTAIAQSGAKMVDVSSGVESKPGVKDAGKIQAFIKAAHG